MFNSAKAAIKITERAKKQGVTQAFIAEKLGVNRSFLNQAIKGQAQITPDRLAIIADLLHTTPEYLMDETDDPAPIKKESSQTEELSPKHRELINRISTADEGMVDFLLSVVEKFEAQKNK